MVHKSAGGLPYLLHGNLARNLYNHLLRSVKLFEVSLLLQGVGLPDDSLAKFDQDMPMVGIAS
jgi:hypothetical protein